MFDWNCIASCQWMSPTTTDPPSRPLFSMLALHMQDSSVIWLMRFRRSLLSLPKIKQSEEATAGNLHQSTILDVATHIDCVSIVKHIVGMLARDTNNMHYQKQVASLMRTASNNSIVEDHSLSLAQTWTCSLHKHETRNTLDSIGRHGCTWNT